MVRIARHLKCHRTLQKNKARSTKTLLKQIFIAACNSFGPGQCSGLTPRISRQGCFFLLGFQDGTNKHKLILKIKVNVNSEFYYNKSQKTIQKSRNHQS